MPPRECHHRCVLLVTAHRFIETDPFLFHQLRATGKPCFVVRNMVDRAIEDGLHDHGLDAAETRRQIQQDITTQLEPDPPDRVSLTSARQPAHHDLQSLPAPPGPQSPLFERWPGGPKGAG